MLPSGIELQEAMMRRVSMTTRNELVTAVAERYSRSDRLLQRQQPPFSAQRADAQ